MCVYIYMCIKTSSLILLSLSSLKTGSADIPGFSLLPLTHLMSSLQVFMQTNFLVSCFDKLSTLLYIYGLQRYWTDYINFVPYHNPTCLPGNSNLKPFKAIFWSFMTDVL